MDVTLNVPTCKYNAYSIKSKISDDHCVILVAPVDPKTSPDGSHVIVSGSPQKEDIAAATLAPHDVLSVGIAADLDGTPSSGESIRLIGLHPDGIAHCVSLDNPLAKKSELVTTITGEDVVETIHMALATDDEGIITTTPMDIVREINQNSKHITAMMQHDAEGDAPIANAAKYALQKNMMAWIKRPDIVAWATGNLAPDKIPSSRS